MAAATTSDYAFDNNNNNNNNTKGENSRSQILGQSTAEELILPPPSCWFEDDLAAAAPSDDEESNCEDEPGCPLEDSCEQIPERPTYRINGHGNSTCILPDASSSQATTTANRASATSLNIPPPSPLLHKNKTPPLASFRMDPSLTPPQVVAAPSPSWKEISSQVLPSAAKELLSSSLRRICHTARLSYAKGRWTRKYSDLGNNSGGYFKTNNSNGTSNNNNNIMEAQQFADLPPFSSLSWVDRQMVQEWRTYLPEDEEETKQEDTHTNNAVVDEEDVDFDRARTLVPQPMTRPRWQKSEICHECRKPFGPTRLRHHCRLCGYSFCQAHSSCSHSLPHLGYDPDVPERVCDPCKRGLLAQNLAERVAWRLCRCRDLQSRQLSPYFETGIDTVEEAALRIAHAALATARSIPLGAQAHVAVETVEVLRKHGLNGIYGIMLRQEFLAAADLLRKALGINKTAWPLSVHELSAAIFYALAQHRAMRGINPDREEIIHTFVQEVRTTNDKPNTNNQHIVIDETDEYDPQIEHLTSFPKTSSSRPKGNPQPSVVTELKKDTTTCSSSSSDLPFTPVCSPVPDHVLNSLIFYAPIALNFIYAEKEVDMQLLAAQQGWRLLYADLNPEKGRDGGMVTDMPASAVFVHEGQKTACVAVRGTATIHDVVTDVRQMPVSFPEMDSTNSANEGWTSVKQGEGLAVCGMASAAVNLFREHIDVVLHLMRQGYRTRIVGHSLGGGVATLLGVLVLKEMEQTIAREKLKTRSLAELLRVYSYGPPSCVDANLADFTKSFVTTVVLHDDVVPRLTPTSCRGLLKHLLHIRETWVKTHLSNDLMAIGERARLAWAPRWRNGFTLTGTTKLAVKSSSQSLQRYCKKKILSGKRQLQSVKGKIIREAMAAAIGSSNHYSAGQTGIEEKKQDLPVEEEAECNLFVKALETNEPDFRLEGAGVFNDDEGGEEVREPARQQVVDYMGGLDNRVETMVIDGDEFFDADEDLIESEEESKVATELFVDAFDEARSYEIESSSRTEAKTNASDYNKTAMRVNEDDSHPLQNHKEDAASNEASNEVPNVTEPDTSEEDDGPGAVVLEEMPLPRMFAPGNIVHLYSHRGVFKAAYVPRAFRELRRISLAGNMLTDHTTKAYYESLLEIRSVRSAEEEPPRWTAFDEDDTCSCCASRFTWASTSDSEAQEARDKHNCRSCGTLVCNPCSENRIPLPSVGLQVPVRVCDRCYNDIGGALTHPSPMTNSILDECGNKDERTKSVDRPERQRERRSLVVDDLAARIQKSALTCS